MKLSELFTEALEAWKKYGNIDVQIDLLTENQSNVVKVTAVNVIQDKFIIDGEIGDIKEFKKRLK